MRDLLILLRYIPSSFSSSSRSTRARSSPSQRSRRYRSSINSFVLTSLILLFALGIPFYFLSKDLFSILNQPLSQLGLPYSGYLSDMFLAQGLLVGGLLLFLSYSPGVAFNLFGGEDMQFLLSLPISRSTIFFFKALDSLSLGMVGVVMILPITIAYATSLGFSWGLALLASIFFLLLVGTISLLVAALMAKLFSNTALKRTSTMVYLLSILLYVAIQMIFPQNPQDLASLFIGLKNFFGLIYSPYLFTSWILAFIQGKVWGALPLVILLVLFSFLTMNVTKRMAFEERGGAKKRREARFSSRKFPWPFLRKDFKLFIREPANIYGLVFPVVLVLALTFTTPTSAENPLSLAFVPFVMSLYSTYLSAAGSAMLLREERLTWPIPRSFPLEGGAILSSKFWLPALINTLVYSLALIIISLIKNLGYLYLFTIPLNFCLSLICSSLGSYFYLLRPVTTSKNYFTFSQVLILELLSFVGVALTVLPLFFFLASQSIGGEATLPTIAQGVYPYLWGILLPLAISVAIILIFLRLEKRLSTLLLSWD